MPTNGSRSGAGAACEVARPEAILFGCDRDLPDPLQADRTNTLTMLQDWLKDPAQ